MNWSLILERGVMQEFVSRNNVAVIRRYISNVIDRNRIEMSTDNGVTWKLIFSQRSYSSYDQIMISDSGFVFACTYDQYSPARIVRYNGSEWDTIGTPITTSFSYIIDAAIDNLNNIYLICRSSGNNILLISTDYGNSWNRKLEVTNLNSVNIGLDNTLIVTKDIADVSDGAVFISTDYGTSWNYIGLSDKWIYSMAGDRQGKIYAATSEGIYVNEDRSTTWKYLSPEAESFDAIIATKRGAVLTTAGICQSWWCYTESGRSSTIFRTTNGGEFWSPSGTRSQDVFTLTTTPFGYLLAGTLGNRIFRSASGGTGWSQVPPDSIGSYVYSFAQHGQTIYAGTDEGLYATTDNGESWKNLTGQTFGGSVYSAVVNPNGKIIVGSNFGIYTSSDGGYSWISSGLPNSQVLFLTIDLSGKIYADADVDGVFFSTDGGLTWVCCNLVRDDIQTITTNETGEIFVGVYGGVLHSTDGGWNWMEHKFTNTYIYSIAFNAAQHIFAGTYNGIYVSRNNGQNWTFSGLSNSSVLSLVLDSQQNLYAGLYHNGVYRSERPVTGVDMISSNLPRASQLYQNYPNPFNPSTEIGFDIHRTGMVKIKIFDILGRDLITLVDEKKNPGHYNVSLNASGLSGGIYFCRLQIDQAVVDLKKMALIQ
ncbi:MAG: T9SS type A sorting domain-containing protein [Ignavibacteriales bacterium]|nr:T9SS type A sorting domain-containing protein [Ignavibacteriales bacterium]